MIIVTWDLARIRTCAWVCTRMVNVTTCMHRHQCAFKHNSCCASATTRRNSANTTMHSRTCTVQNLQSLKSAQPCPRIRGYHRNLIVVQLSVTNISPSNHISAVQIFSHACVIDILIYHIYPSNYVICNSTHSVESTTTPTTQLYSAIPGIPLSK